MEYTTLEQVKIRLKQFHIDTVTNDDETTSDVVVFDKKEDNPLIEQLINQNEDLVINLTDKSDDERKEYLAKKQSAIVELTLYDRNKTGADYSSSYSENGLTRQWEKKEDIFAFYNIRRPAKIV